MPIFKTAIKEHKSTIEYLLNSLLYQIDKKKKMHLIKMIYIILY